MKHPFSQWYAEPCNQLFQIFVSRLKKDRPSYFTVGPAGFEVDDDAKRELLLIICSIFGEQWSITFSMELMDCINNQDCIRTEPP